MTSKSNNRLQKLRRKAAKSQGGRCYYCELPMWETDPEIFSARFRIPSRAAWLFRCTAEHLEARCDGGRDIEENVVAACHYCNWHRHRTKQPKDAVSYKNHVRLRMKQGRWHPVGVAVTNPLLRSPQVATSRQPSPEQGG